MATSNVVLPFAHGVKNALEKELGRTRCWDNGSRHMILRTTLDMHHHDWKLSPISRWEKHALDMFHRKAHDDITKISDHGYDSLSGPQKDKRIMTYVAMMIEDATAFSC